MSSEKVENKICQNCKQNFTIDSEDFKFYEKIKVPSPTFCPECRFQRRLLFRNNRVFYRRECALCKKSLLSVYNKEHPYTVYCRECWLSDKWNPIDYGHDYDFSIPFFSQFRSLKTKVPKANLHQTNFVSSEYCNYGLDFKECYLLFGGNKNERVYFGNQIFDSRDSLDIAFSEKAELSYELFECARTNKLFFSRYSSDCVDSYYLIDCRNCMNCFGCINLVNKQYYVFNEQYTKEEYFPLVEKIKKQMNEMPFIDKRGLEHKYGGQIPIDLCSWVYNESAAYEFFPISKEEAIAKGFTWRDPDPREYLDATINLPDHIKDVTDDILREILKCEVCGKNYQIIQKEFQFLKRFNLPIPRYCPLCRDRNRIKQLNPMETYNRICDKCEIQIETSYSSDRPEIVYCEKCYQQEVY
jgi:hypothetical protein